MRKVFQMKFFAVAVVMAVAAEVVESSLSGADILAGRSLSDFI